MLRHAMLDRLLGRTRDPIGFDDLARGCAIVSDHDDYETNGSWTLVERVVREQLAEGTAVVVVEDAGTYLADRMIELSKTTLRRHQTIAIQDGGVLEAEQADGMRRPGLASASSRIHDLGYDAETTSVGVRTAFPLLGKQDADLVEALSYFAASRREKTFGEAIQRVAFLGDGYGGEPLVQRCHDAVLAARGRDAIAMPERVDAALRDYVLRVAHASSPKSIPRHGKLGAVVGAGGLLLVAPSGRRNGADVDPSDIVRLHVALAVEAARKSGRRILVVTAPSYVPGALWRMSATDEGMAFLRYLRGLPHVGYLTTVDCTSRTGMPWTNARNDVFRTRTFLGGSDVRLLPSDEIAPGRPDRIQWGSFAHRSDLVTYRTTATQSRL